MVPDPAWNKGWCQCQENCHVSVKMEAFQASTSARTTYTILHLGQSFHCLTVSTQALETPPSGEYTEKKSLRILQLVQFFRDISGMWPGHAGTS